MPRYLVERVDTNVTPHERRLMLITYQNDNVALTWCHTTWGTRGQAGIRPGQAVRVSRLRESMWCDAPPLFYESRIAPTEDLTPRLDPFVSGRWAHNRWRIVDAQFRHLCVRRADRPIESPAGAIAVRAGEYIRCRRCGSHITTANLRVRVRPA